MLSFVIHIVSRLRQNYGHYYPKQIMALNGKINVICMNTMNALVYLILLDHHF